jgi:hypothetical protein
MDGRTYLAWPFEQASTHFGVLLIAQYQLGHCMENSKEPSDHKNNTAYEEECCGVFEKPWLVFRSP